VPIGLVDKGFGNSLKLGARTKHARNTEADVDDVVMNDAPHILLVDDHRNIREPLAAF
jgi:hypothetical protein